MSASTHPIIVLSDSYVEDAFSFTNTPDYTLALPDYSPASPRNTSSDSSEDLSKDLLASLTISPFHYDPYMKVFEMGESSHKTHLERHEEQIETILNHLDELPLERIEHMEDKIEGLGNGRDFYSRDDHRGYPVVIPLYLAVSCYRLMITMVLLPSGFLKALYPGIMDMINDQDIEHMIPPTPTRDTKPPVKSPISLSPSSSVGSSSPVRMAPKRTSTSAAPAMTQAAIKKLVADSTEGAVCLIRWFEQTESVFLCSKCTEDYKVKFATGTLTEEALSWWNSFAKPIVIEEAYKIPWSELKKLLIKKYYPRTEIKKMKDELYNLTVKENDLKTYVRRFQELAVLYPTMVPNSEKLMEVFIGGLPRSIEGNVTASKPQTLEEGITITQRLMDQVIKHNSVQGTNDHK
ncbi:reverse transcriptase domain-containing protein [Tanacetum coccineum]